MLVPSLEANPRDEDLRRIGLGIDDFNRAATGETLEKNQLSFFIRSRSGEIIGGGHGSYNNSGWLHIEGVWVAENYRQSGLGTTLMESIEGEAKKRGCNQCHLTTIDFQAPDFYKKQGYVIFATLECYHQDHHRFFLRKQLR